MKCCLVAFSDTTSEGAGAWWPFLLRVNSVSGGATGCSHSGTFRSLRSLHSVTHSVRDTRSQSRRRLWVPSGSSRLHRPILVSPLFYSLTWMVKIDTKPPSHVSICGFPQMRLYEYLRKSKSLSTVGWLPGSSSDVCLGQRHEIAPLSKRLTQKRPQNSLQGHS